MFLFKWQFSWLNFPHGVKRELFLAITAAIIVLIHNQAFFAHAWKVYGHSPADLLFMISLAVLLGALLVLLLNFICIGPFTKPVLILTLLVASVCNYFSSAYDTVFDVDMIRNLMQTNAAESFDLVGMGLLLHVLLSGLLPAVVLYRVPLQVQPFMKELRSLFITGGICLSLMALILFGFGRNYASFFREHKPLRYYANPIYGLYSAGKWVSLMLESPISGERAVVGGDSRFEDPDGKRELIILVVGESARADHFSLNGYPRLTNPRLECEDVISFQNVFACGTSTAVSVPCMFSNFPRNTFDTSIARQSENLLDLLTRAGVQVLWRDNNSDSKGVAVAVNFEDFKSPKTNPNCDLECRDEGMLAGLEDYIESQPEGDLLIVLHQMGNHGPAYYKRYPKAFETFTPTCESNQLQDCTDEEIRNSYDNILVYTDDFLAKVIGLLKKYDHSQNEVAMFYVSDHGESLGENGVYLHGFPYALAPDAQKHIPVIFWFGKGFLIDQNQIREKVTNLIGHEFLFHTMLGIFEVETEAYLKELDLSR